MIIITSVENWRTECLFSIANRVEKIKEIHYILKRSSGFFFIFSFKLSFFVIAC